MEVDMPKISFSFTWVDLWIGFYYDQRKQALYICPLPCCTIKLDWGRAEDTMSKMISLLDESLGLIEHLLKTQQTVGPMNDAGYQQAMEQIKRIRRKFSEAKAKWR